MFNFFRKNKKQNTKNNGIKNLKFNIEMPQSALLSIGNSPFQNVPVSPLNYTGRFLKKENDIITVGICAIKDEPLIYEEKSVVGVSFGYETFDETKAKLFNFSAKISKIRDVEEQDNFTFEDLHSLFSEKAEEKDYVLFIFELEAVSEVRESSKREFFRIDVTVPVYYKPDSDEYINIRDDKGDVARGFIRMDTIDISAGGFKCQSRRYIEPGTILNCMMLFKHEALPVSIKILDIELLSQQSEEREKIEENKSVKDIYLMRALFFELHEDIRDRLVMHVFEHQQKAQRLQHHIKKLRESYRLRKQ